MSSASAPITTGITVSTSAQPVQLGQLPPTRSGNGGSARNTASIAASTASAGGNSELPAAPVLPAQ